MGKTEFLEKLFAGFAEVVSADALQVYRGMDIGTAKPPAETLARIPHHLIDILDVDEAFNVGDFCHRAELCVRDILSRGLTPVISGGTAYYMKTWLMGLPKTPPVDLMVRRKVQNRWKNRNNADIHRELQRIDPQSAGRIAQGDRYRMLRALEVFEQCSKPLSDYQIPEKPRDDVEVLSIGLRRSREDLVRRIEERVDSMLIGGLQGEVDRLRRCGAAASDPGMKGIGYREWFGTPDKPDPSPGEVRELIIRNTRRFAKRQMTFFASLPNAYWVDVHDDDKALAIVEETLRNFGIRRCIA